MRCARQARDVSLPPGTISGAGEGVTVIKLERWPDIQISDDFRKFIVVGCHYTPSLISNVIIGYLTVDGQWDTLPRAYASKFRLEL